MNTRTLRRIVPALALLAVAACARTPDSTARAASASSVEAGHTAPAGGGATLYDLASEWRTQAGDTLGIGRLAGKVRVVAMVYTSCHATCPLIVQDLKRLESSLPAAQREDVGFVLVSLDPQRDTPGRLAEWAASVQLDTTRWTLLAGDDGSVRELAAALGIRYQEAQDGEIAHGNTISVLDAAGVVVHQRTSIREPVTRLASVIDGLLR